MKIISGSSNQPLAEKIARSLDLKLIDVEISKFPNGEKRIWVKEPVKGENIVLIQSFSTPVDEMIMEVLLMTDALQRMGARHINLVIPWMGYSIQDKAFREGEPIAAKVVANLISTAYIKRIFLLDLHNSSIPGFFSLPTQHLSALDIFADYAKEHFDMSECIVTSPDFGGLKRARVFAETLGVELTNIDKHRDLHSGKVTAVGVYGDVEGKVVLVFDDFINTGSTVESASKLLKENGAKEVHFFTTHGLFANNGYQRIADSQVDSVIVTNSLPQPESATKVKVVDCSSLFSDALSIWRPEKEQE